MQYPLFSLFLILYFILVISSDFTSAGPKVKKNVEENEDGSDETKDESMDIPSETELKNITNCTRRSNSNVHEIRKAAHHQFPFVAALMSSRNEYVCAGSMVANGLILTSADCAASANYALINTTSAKKDKASIMLHVLKSENFPTNDKNVALIYTRKVNNSMASQITLSNISRAEDITEVEVIGFGLNAEVGHHKEMQYVGLDVFNDGSISHGSISCIDTKVPSCFRDVGGPVVVNNHLVGVVTNGETECTAEMTSKYDMNKHMIDFIHAFVFKAWLNEKIVKNNEEHSSVRFYSRKAHRKPVHVLTSGAVVIETSLSPFLVHIIIINIL